MPSANFKCKLLNTYNPVSAVLIPYSGYFSVGGGV